MGGRSATPNTSSFLVYSINGEWSNESMEFDATNRSRVLTSEGTYNLQYDVFIMIVTASVLGLVILATVIGECEISLVASSIAYACVSIGIPANSLPYVSRLTSKE